MVINIIQTLLAGFLASVVWFFAGFVLYMNPVVAKSYKKFENAHGLKKWTNVTKYLVNMYVLGILIPSLLFAFVYALVKPALPGGILPKALLFGLILVAVKIFPRFADMYMQTAYPNKLLAVEFINGTICSFVIALIFALTI